MSSSCQASAACPRAWRGPRRGQRGAGHEGLGRGTAPGHRVWAAERGVWDGTERRLEGRQSSRDSGRRASTDRGCAAATPGPGPRTWPLSPSTGSRVPVASKREGPSPGGFLLNLYSRQGIYNSFQACIPVGGGPESHPNLPGFIRGLSAAAQHPPGVFLRKVDGAGASEALLFCVVSESQRQSKPTWSDSRLPPGKTEMPCTRAHTTQTLTHVCMYTHTTPPTHASRTHTACLGGEELSSGRDEAPTRPSGWCRKPVPLLSLSSAFRRSSAAASGEPPALCLVPSCV